MTGWVAGGIVIGLLLVLYGLQTLARSLHDTPIDTLRPGPLIQRPPAQPELAPPPSLSLTEQLVEDASVSGAVAQQRLWPLLVSLARERSIDPSALRPPGGDTRRWLREMLDVLEGR
ncbi:MAG: hypothetical protein P8N02_18785 [Actinomycetota bacterium]|nr:hypothetical protein [Actinomycetota bacterium]